MAKWFLLSPEASVFCYFSRGGLSTHIIHEEDRFSVEFVLTTPKSFYRIHTKIGSCLIFFFNFHRKYCQFFKRANWLSAAPLAGAPGLGLRVTLHSEPAQMFPLIGNGCHRGSVGTSASGWHQLYKKMKQQRKKWPPHISVHSRV